MTPRRLWPALSRMIRSRPTCFPIRRSARPGRRDISRRSCATASRFGEVWTTEGAPLGAAVWLPPGEWEVTPERAAAAGLDDLPRAIGEGAAERFFSALGAVEPYHREIPPHWYLMVIGVAPEGRGRGLGRALIQPMLDRADAAGVPCYLETAQPGNVAFYEHLGFTQLKNVVEPQSNLGLWTFRRDPPLE